MRVHDLLMSVGALLAVIVIGAAAVYAGRAVGRPDAPAAPEIPVYEPALPAVAGGLLGFEGLGDRLATGPWGTVVSVEDATVRVEQSEGDYVDAPGKRVGLDANGRELVLELSRDDGVRELATAAPSAGDRVAVRVNDDGTVGLLVIR